MAIRLAQTTEIQDICTFLGSAIISTSANISREAFINNVHIIDSVFGDIMVFDNKLENQATPSRIVDISTGETIR